jgi:hypothetical protein
LGAIREETDAQAIIMIAAALVIAVYELLVLSLRGLKPGKGHFGFIFKGIPG